MKNLLLPLFGASFLALGACSNNTSTEGTSSTATSSTPADSSAMMSTTDSTMMRPAGADSTQMASANPNGPTAPHANDTEFMMSAAHSDQNEIQLSRMALSKGVSEKVKDFANKMIADHTKSTANLKPIAAKAGVTLPADMDAEHKAMAPQMQKLVDKEFEDRYIQQMVTDHQKTANTLKAYQTTTKNQALQGWITTTLPVVENHLAMAKQDNKMKM